MLLRLKGYPSLYRERQIIIDVRGIGFVVFCTKSFLSTLVEDEEIAILVDGIFTGEDFQMYGFPDENEHFWFKFLRKVKGVSWSLSFKIIDDIGVVNLTQIIFEKEFKKLCEVPGVGKVLARRIVTELKYHRDLPSYISTDPLVYGYDKVIVDKAVSALNSLGYGETTAKSFVLEVIREGKIKVGLEELIKKSLNKARKNAI